MNVLNILLIDRTVYTHRITEGNRSLRHFLPLRHQCSCTDNAVLPDSYYGNHFWLLYEGDKLLAFVDGFVTDEPDLTDVMYEDAALHNEQGAWQMIFGVNTLPEYRRHGYAGQLLRRVVADARQQGRKGLVLTCKERLLPYYAKFGFQDEGVTDKSTHGNVAWHQMRLSF